MCVGFLRIPLYPVEDRVSYVFFDEILRIIDSKAYYIAYRVDEEIGEVDFITKEIPQYGKEIEPGIICSVDCYDVFYCFNPDFDYCLRLVRQEVAKDISDAIQEHTKIIAKLQKELDTYKDESVFDLDESEGVSNMSKEDSENSLFEIGDIVNMRCGEQGIVVEMLDNKYLLLLQCSGHVEKVHMNDIWVADTEQNGKAALNELFTKTFGYSGLDKDLNFSRTELTDEDFWGIELTDEDIPF